MRYRPFGRSGVAVSAITLGLGPSALARGPEMVRSLIYAALENGVNSFHLSSADPVLAEVVGQALAAMDRRLVLVSLALGRHLTRRGEMRDFSPEALTGAIDQALHVSGLGWIDLAMLDAPTMDELPQTALNALKAQRTTGRVKLLGISGDHEEMDAYISTNAFDALALTFHVNSPWTTRARMRAALERDMGVIAYGAYPEGLGAPKKAEGILSARKGLFGFGGREAETPTADSDTFGFLHQTNNWSAEEICLAAALTDPVVSSVLIEANDTARLEALAQVPERDLPPGLAAMIEMARVRTAA
jgi:aryl-alcohol dehydrogenase-like predicted oxidoreductase